MWVLGAARFLSLIFGFTHYREAQFAKTRMQAAQQRALFTVTHVETSSQLAKARGSSSVGQQINFLPRGGELPGGQKRPQPGGSDGVD